MRVELAEETCLPREEHLPARDAGSSLWNPERQCDRRADAAHLCDAPSCRRRQHLSRLQPVRQVQRRPRECGPWASQGGACLWPWPPAGLAVRGSDVAFRALPARRAGRRVVSIHVFN